MEKKCIDFELILLIVYLIWTITYLVLNFTMLHKYKGEDNDYNLWTKLVIIIPIVFIVWANSKYIDDDTKNVTKHSSSENKKICNIWIKYGLLATAVLILVNAVLTINHMVNVNDQDYFKDNEEYYKLNQEEKDDLSATRQNINFAQIGISLLFGAVLGVSAYNIKV